MTPGSNRIGLTRFNSAILLKRATLGLASALLVGGGVWLLMSPSESNGSEQLAVAAVEPATPAAQATAAVTPAAEAAELDRMRISSQTWRRGGLGSRALVTFTLRNDNDYAVKDLELFCSFTRRDGSHLTDRKRLVPDVVDMKSRKTFAKVQVGFVNVNADKAKCSLVSAHRA
jgi:hypothetical protein